MKAKVTEKILDYKGEPIKENEIKISPALIDALEKMGNKTTVKSIIDMLRKETEKEPLTYRDVIFNALNSLKVDDDNKAEIMSAKDKSTSYEITTKLFASNEPDFTNSQRDFILERIDKIYNTPLICGRVKDLFEKEPTGSK